MDPGPRLAAKRSEQQRLVSFYYYSYRNLLPEVSRVGAATVHPELPENVRGGEGDPRGVPGRLGQVGGNKP